MSGKPFQGRDILPNNATPLEEILADLQWDRNAALDPDIIRTIVDPYACPAILLPWLAWSLSVDVWDDKWPEAVKRRVIAASPEVHRAKGTRKAVRLALEALGVLNTITEWWEATPPARRGTFVVTLTADGTGPVFDLTLLRQAALAVRRAKPKSRVGTFRLLSSAKGRIYVAGMEMAIGKATLLPRLPPWLQPKGPIYTAGRYLPDLQRVTLFPRGGTGQPITGAVQVAGAFRRELRRATLFPRLA